MKFAKTRDPRTQSQMNNPVDEINRLGEIRDPPYMIISRNFRGCRVTYRVNGRDEREPETFSIELYHIYLELLEMNSPDNS